MDYGSAYTATSYGAQGGAGGGGFMPGGSQADSPATGKRSYGKDTLRPVTIKQLIDSVHPNPEAEYFLIDGTETTQITFVGQVRNISTQTTNITYKLDDGTGIIEVKVWVDAGEEMDAGTAGKARAAEQGYARVWGRLKEFNGRRHVGANIIRPISDLNEVQYHLLEATAVHLHFTRGPVEQIQAQSKGGAPANGGLAMHGPGGGGGGGAGAGLPPMSKAAARVYHAIKDTPQGHEGVHVQLIATSAGMDINDVVRGGEELMNNGLIYSTLDEHTWAILDS